MDLTNKHYDGRFETILNEGPFAHGVNTIAQKLGVSQDILPDTTYQSTKEYYLNPFNNWGAIKTSHKEKGEPLAAFQDYVKRVMPKPGEDAHTIATKLKQMGVGVNVNPSPKIANKGIYQFDFVIGNPIGFTSQAGKKWVATIKGPGHIPNTVLVEVINPRGNNSFAVNAPINQLYPVDIRAFRANKRVNLKTNTPPVTSASVVTFQQKADAILAGMFDATPISVNLNGSEDVNGVFDKDGNIYADEWGNLLNTMNEIYTSAARKGYGDGVTAYEIITKTIFSDKVKRSEKIINGQTNVSETFLKNIHDKVLIPGFVKQRVLVYMSPEMYKKQIVPKGASIIKGLGNQLMSAGKAVPTPRI